MDYTSQIILQIQREHAQAVDEYARLLKEQFDLFVEIAILRIIFREDETADIHGLELQIFELESHYEAVKNFDQKIFDKQHQIEMAIFSLNTL